MVKVFFGCSMRGRHDNVSVGELTRLQAIVEELGHQLVTRHQTDPGIYAKERALTKAQIHDRDYA